MTLLHTSTILFLKIKSYHQNQQLILVVSAIASMPLTRIPVYLPHHLHLLEAFPFATNVPCLTQKPLSHKSPPKPLPPPPLFAVQAPPTFPVFSRCHCLRPVSQSKHNTSVSNSCPDVDIEVAVATVGKVKLPAFVCHIFARPFLGSGIL